MKDKYKIGDRIGNGSFGVVHKLKIEDQEMAIKIFNDREHCEVELKVLQKLSKISNNNNFFPSVYDFSKHKETNYIIMPLYR